METLKILSETPLALGCVLRTEIIKSPGFDAIIISDHASDLEIENITNNLSTPPQKLTMTSGYNSENQYIGNEEISRFLCIDKGIYPEYRTKNSGCCSIGFCKAENKWYGWSHRAIYGFGINSVCKKGDCGYQASNPDSFGVEVMNFFVGSEYHLNTKYIPSVNSDGKRGVKVTALYSNGVPNEKLRGTIYEHFEPYPEVFGRGEWIAETLDDAKQMAIDFAEGVS